METYRLKDGPSYFHFLQVRLSLLLSQTSSILQHKFKLTVSDMIFRNVQPFFGSTLLGINNEVKCAVMWGFATSRLTTQRRLRHWKRGGTSCGSLTQTELFFSSRSFLLVPFALDENIVGYFGETWGRHVLCQSREILSIFTFLQKDKKKHINTVNPLDNHFYVRLCIFNISRK